MITIEQLLESVDLDFEPRFITKDESGLISIWDDKPSKDFASNVWIGRRTGFVVLPRIKLVDFTDKPWQECIYEVPQKVKIADKIEELDLSVPNNKMLTDLEQIEIKINEVIDAVNKHADIIQQIGEWGTSKGECLWCETIDKA